MTGPTPRITVLVVGATGSIGQLVVKEAAAKGHAVRALVRDTRKARKLGDDVELVVGDLTRADSLTAAVDGVDAIVFTHGSYGDSAEAERVDYGAVRNVLTALGGRSVRVALMTAIGVTDRRTDAHDWKRRGERFVRRSGLSYTIVRPGWFDYNKADEHRLTLLQGDRRQAGDPSDGVIARRQIAEVLASHPMPRCERRSSSSPRTDRRRTTSSHCSPRSIRIRAGRSTRSTTLQTCRWSRSRGAYATIWTR